MLDFEPTSTIKANLGLNKNGRLSTSFANTCAIHMDKYVPYREGYLSQYYIVDNKIVYDQEYAQYQYYGVSKYGKKFNYTKDKHQLANNYWDKRMWSAEKDAVARELQKEAERILWR